MTPLAQTALDFCRECLGWEDARLLGDSFISCSLASRGQLDAVNLNAVMEAVRGWCEANSAVLNLACSCGTIMAHIRLLTLGDVEVWSHCDTVHEALLAVCVEAARKMKEAACTR